eukprot:9000444-Pyramimonas_sp.AAC.1
MRGGGGGGKRRERRGGWINGAARGCEGTEGQVSLKCSEPREPQNPPKSEEYQRRLQRVLYAHLFSTPRIGQPRAPPTRGSIGAW